MEIDYMVLSLVVFIVLLVVMFATVKVDYVGAGDNRLSAVPVDMLNERNPTGVRSGFNLASVSSAANSKSSDVANNRVASRQADTVGKNNPNAPKYGLFNLPEKDDYMSPQLREQIDTLRTQYYYDNCQYTLLPTANSNNKN